MAWETIDVAALLSLREATLSANAGAFPVPLGQVPRPVEPAEAYRALYGKKRKKKK